MTLSFLIVLDPDRLIGFQNFNKWAMISRLDTWLVGVKDHLVTEGLIRECFGGMIEITGSLIDQLNPKNGGDNHKRVSYGINNGTKEFKRVSCPLI